MFGLDLFELLIILLVVMIFINPRDLPRFFRRVGKLYGQWRSLTTSLNRTIKNSMQQELTATFNPTSPPVTSEEKSPEVKEIKELQESAAENKVAGNKQEPRPGVKTETGPGVESKAKKAKAVLSKPQNAATGKSVARAKRQKTKPGAKNNKNNKPKTTPKATGAAAQAKAKKKNDL